jgi:hypothetical protein
MPQSEISVRLEERLNYLASSYDDIKIILNALSSNLSDLTKKIAIVEHVSDEIEEIKQNINSLKGQVTLLDKQTTPISEYQGLRDRVIVLEQKINHGSATFGTIYNTFLHVLAVVLAGALVYHLGIK